MPTTEVTYRLAANGVPVRASREDGGRFASMDEAFASTGEDAAFDLVF